MANTRRQFLQNALGTACLAGVLSLEEAVGQAVEEIKSKFPAKDLYLYLATLHAQNPETWNGLEEVLPGLQA